MAVSVVEFLEMPVVPGGKERTLRGNALHVSILIHCGLISGYTALRAAFVGEGELTKGNLMMDIAANFGFLNFELPNTLPEGLAVYLMVRRNHSDTTVMTKGTRLDMIFL